MSNGTELILSYAFKLHTCMTNKMKFARFSMRCVCASVCAMHCAHCAYEHTCIFKFIQHIIYTCRAAAAAAAATNVELRMFLHQSVCMDDTHTHTHIFANDDDTQTRYNKAKLCGISLFMVQHVLVAH